jgi:chromosomal replication initiator protein
MAILKKKINDEKQKNFRNQFNIPDDVIYYIASGIKDNIRTLEGALQRLLGYAELKYSDAVETPISIEFAKEALKPFINLEKKVITIEMIQEFVSEKFSIKMEDLKSKNNSPKIAMPRQIAMYLIKRLTKFPLAEIGNSFGGKHHTTVIHSIDKIEKLSEADHDFSKKLNSYVEYFQD